MSAPPRLPVRLRAGPESAQRQAQNAHDVDLQSVIEQWPDLPPAVKAGIVAMVRASGT